MAAIFTPISLGSYPLYLRYCCFPFSFLPFLDVHSAVATVAAVVPAVAPPRVCSRSRLNVHSMYAAFSLGLGAAH